MAATGRSGAIGRQHCPLPPRAASAGCWQVRSPCRDQAVKSSPSPPVIPWAGPALGDGGLLMHQLVTIAVAVMALARPDAGELRFQDSKEAKGGPGAKASKIAPT